VAIAAEVAGAVGRGRVLDWGAGWGQNAALLAAHGLAVIAYDVEDKGAARGLLADTAVAYVVRAGPRLPFDDAAFDAVLNCGVLEHVDEPASALAELRRVLIPGGRLFTYHLPNRHAWTEWLGRRLGRFHHERIYARAEAVALFEAAGFRVIACRPFHLLPRNVWARVPALAARTGGTVEALDAALLRVPGLRRLATAWALIAVRD
jgi:ubiquinone/menaquinone biosynthesis C-methylase UbiE